MQTKQFEPETLILLSQTWRQKRGRTGDAEHNEYDNCESAVAATTYLDQNMIDTTSLKFGRGRLPIFL